MMSFKRYYPMLNEGFKEKIGMLGVLASLAFSTPLLSKSAESLYNQLSRHEGVKSQIYLDTKGIPTIGIGFNLQDPSNKKILSKYGITDKMLKTGLTESQIMSLFNESLDRAKSDALKFLPNLYQHPIPVQNAIIDMAFNLGYTKLNKFVDFKKSLIQKNYEQASKDMLNSLWSKQVGKRAEYLSNLINSSR